MEEAVDETPVQQKYSCDRWNIKIYAGNFRKIRWDIGSVSLLDLLIFYQLE